MRKNLGPGPAKQKLIVWPDALYSMMIMRSTPRAQSITSKPHAVLMSNLVEM